MITIKSLKLGIFLVILAMAIGSWFIIHILAIFGVFLALAYPIFWVFFPKQAVCFFCKATRQKVKCPLCKKDIHNHQVSHTPTFASAIFNASMILFLSLVSAGVVLAESKILFKTNFPPTPKTVSFIIPDKGQYKLGEIFPLKIEVTGIETPVNAIQMDMGFEPEKLEVKSVSTEGSFATIFVQKEINNEAGFVRLSGGLPNPGYSKESGLFGTVYFEAKSPGAVEIKYLPTSMVLANDGYGSNVLKDFNSVSYLILSERVTSEEKQKMYPSNVAKPTDDHSTSLQMKFYEDENVLGETTEKEEMNVKQFNLPSLFLKTLENFDNFVLEHWGKLFKLF